jgi:hypothetical protein
MKSTLTIEFDHDFEFYDFVLQFKPEIKVIAPLSIAEKALLAATDPQKIKTPVEPNKNTVVPKKTKELQITPKAKMPHNLKPIFCLACNKEFKPHHNRVKWCPACKSKQEGLESKKAKKPRQGSA